MIASKSFDNHLHHLQLVFSRDCGRLGLCLKPRKCQFPCEKVPYLGYIISKQGIEPDHGKADKVKNFLHPVQPVLGVV